MNTGGPLRSEDRVSGRLSRMQRFVTAGADPGLPRPPQKSPRGGWGSLAKKTVLLVLVTCLLLITSGFVFLKLYIHQMEPKYVKQLLGLGNASQVLGPGGQKLGPVVDVPRSYVSLEDIERHNPGLVKLLIHVEDRRFFDHLGVDPYGMLRAFMKNAIHMSWKEGASTLTMQVVRNLSNERQITIFRKFMEITRAWALEQKLASLGYSSPKREVLQAYLNLMNFGGRIYGFPDAARVFFGKDIGKETLSPGESAILVASLKGPNVYGPLSKDPDKARQRRDLILDEAEEAGIYDRKAVEEAKQTPLPKVSEQALLRHNTQSGSGSVYRKLILQELEKDFEISSEQLRAGGFQVYTGIQPKEQEATEQALKQDSYYRSDKKSVDTSGWDAASASIDPSTGLVTAIGPGRKYQDGDRITGQQEKQQWGSALKPLSVFGPLLEKTQCDTNEYTMVEDKRIQYGDWEPNNATGGPRGMVPFSQVAAESLNLSTVGLLLNEIGIDESFSTLVKLGLPMKEEDRVPAALALGAQTHGNTALQMAAAYGALANSGVTPCSPHLVDRVVDPEGKEVKPVRDRCAEQQRVFSQQASWCLLRLLKYVHESPQGTGRYMKLGCQQPFRMKTGTTDDGQAGSVCTITPRRSTCVIVYHTDREDKANFGIKHSLTLFPMMQKIMEAAECGRNPVDFARLGGAVDPAPPIEVSELQLSASYDGQSLNLAWSPQWRGGRGYDGRLLYRVTRYDGDTSRVVMDRYAGTALEDPHVEAGRSYTYEVEAYTEDPPPVAEKRTCYYIHKPRIHRGAGG